MNLLQRWRSWRAVRNCKRAARLFDQVDERDLGTLRITSGYGDYVARLLLSAELGTPLPRRWRGHKVIPAGQPDDTFLDLNKTEPAEGTGHLIVHQVDLKTQWEREDQIRHGRIPLSKVCVHCGRDGEPCDVEGRTHVLCPGHKAINEEIQRRSLEETGMDYSAMFSKVKSDLK